VDPPILDEIRSVTKELKSGKAHDTDNITTELLRADSETSAKEIHRIRKKVWSEESIPTDRKRGLIVHHHHPPIKRPHVLW
jgi:hypothetical protein